MKDHQYPTLTAGVMAVLRIYGRMTTIEVEKHLRGMRNQLPCNLEGCVPPILAKLECDGAVKCEAQLWGVVFK